MKVCWGNFSLKGIPFSILLPGVEGDENDLEEEINQIDARFANLSKLAEIKVNIGGE